MASSSDLDTLSPYGAPAPVVRLFGWSMLGVLTAYMINNVLIVAYDFPNIRSVLDGDMRAAVLAGVYAICIAAAAVWVTRTPGRALRYDARNISRFNAYLIRGFFFAVLFIGIADAVIAFLRVENLFILFVSEETSKDMIRAHFVAPWIHIPLLVLGFVVALFSRTLGFIWLALLIVVAELLIVFSRFVFSYEQALMGDLVRYWYAALFLFSSAYTLLEEGHVRVDVLYSGYDTRRRGKVNAVGSIMLGMTTCWAIILIGMSGKQSIVNSPIANFEVSQSGSAGMYIKYQMAGFIAIFAITMLIQFVSYLFEAVADRRDEPGRHEPAAASH